MSKLLINEPPLQVLPTLAKIVGLNKAIVLQQIHYWLGIPKIGKLDDNGVKWIRNSLPEWQRDNFPFWSEKTIKRILDGLVEDGLIKRNDRLNKYHQDRTRWYTINYELLNQAEKAGQLVTPEIEGGGDKLSPPTGQLVTPQPDNLSPTLPETTSETTSEIGGGEPPSPHPTEKQNKPGSELDWWFAARSESDSDQDTAIRQIESIWQKRISQNIKLAIAYYYLAMVEAGLDIALPRDKTTQGKWASGVTDHLDNYSLDDLKRLYPLAIKHAKDREWDIYSPHSLTSALSKVNSYSEQENQTSYDYKSDPQYQFFLEAERQGL